MVTVMYIHRAGKKRNIIIRYIQCIARAKNNVIYMQHAGKEKKNIYIYNVIYLLFAGTKEY